MLVMSCKKTHHLLFTIFLICVLGHYITALQVYSRLKSTNSVLADFINYIEQYIFEIESLCFVLVCQALEG